MSAESVTKTASILGVRRAALSPEMALRVEKAFGLSMEMPLKMRAWHDAARMRARS